MDAFGDGAAPIGDGRPWLRPVGPAAFVWLVWALMVWAALTVIARGGSRVPYWDDWALVPVLTGHAPFDWHFLWTPHNEHRIPLPLSIQVGLLKLTGGDFRAGMYFNATLLALLAGLLVVAAARLRGNASYADAFLPVALLNPGHWNTLVWGFQVTFTFATFLAGLVLFVMCARGRSLSAGGAVIASVCVVLLPLCGASGVALVPAFAGWLVIEATGALCRREGRSWTKSLTCLAGAAVAGALLVIYLKGFKRVHPAAPDNRTVLRTAVEFLTMSLGQAADKYWNWTGYGALILLGLTTLFLAWAWFVRPASRGTAFALLTFLAGFGAVALGIGWGRAGLGCAHSGLASRYVTLAAPALCAVYLAWGIAGRGQCGAFVQIALFGVACLFCLPNFQEGFTYARAHRAAYLVFENELKAGLPPRQLAERHLADVFPDKPYLRLCLVMLKQSGNPVYRSLRDDGPNPKTVASLGK